MDRWGTKHYFPFLLAPLRVEPRRGLGLSVLGQGLEVERGRGGGEAGQRRKATHKVWPSSEDRPGVLPYTPNLVSLLLPQGQK